MTGPLETFANAGGVHLARALLAEFAGNMARLAAERAAPAAAEATGDRHRHRAAAAGELRGGALLWRAFLGWLRQILFAKRKTQ